MFTIYGFNTFNAAKVVLTAEELGLKYRFVMLNPAQGDLATPQHLERHPWGKIPVLEHGDHRLFESGAICRYLANVHQQALYSAEPAQAARIDQTMDAMGYHAGRWLTVYFWQEVVRPTFFKKSPEPEAIAEAAQFLEKQLPFFDRLLEQNAFLCGDQMTIADTFAFPYFRIQETASVDLSEYGNINRWYAAISQRPAVTRMKSVLNQESLSA